MVKRHGVIKFHLNILLQMNTSFLAANTVGIHLSVGDSYRFWGPIFEEVHLVAYSSVKTGMEVFPQSTGVWEILVEYLHTLITPIKISIHRVNL